MSQQPAVQEDILARARSLTPVLRELRQTIHARPELSFHETETAKLVAARLSKMGYEVRPGIAATGVTADMGRGRTIIIRADLDALPIEELNDTTYRSKTSGVMHACGHDAHVACALGAAMIIAEAFKQARKPNGRVRFLFQPAEECVDEAGKSGAALMIEQGVLHEAEAIIALHVFPNLPVGSIAVKDGPLLAGCDTFDVKIKGKQSHGAYPEDGLDAVVIASHVVQAIQTVVSRRKSALDPAVITLGGIRSSTYRSNIISQEVEITGTVRYFDRSLQKHLQSEIEKALGIAEALGGSFELRYVNDNPPLVNDPQLVNVVRSVAAKLLGKESVKESTLEMGADDFSFFSQQLPSCYFLMGAELKGDTRMLHTPTFDIDEEALPIGAALLAESAMHFLGMSDTN